MWPNSKISKLIDAVWSSWSAAPSRGEPLAVVYYDGISPWYYLDLEGGKSYLRLKSVSRPTLALYYRLSNFCLQGSMTHFPSDFVIYSWYCQWPISFLSLSVNDPGCPLGAWIELRHVGLHPASLLLVSLNLRIQRKLGCLGLSF